MSNKKCGPPSPPNIALQRRRAAWARVRRDIFPILGNPDGFMRPLRALGKYWRN
jgi:hypothetical protein